MKTGQCKPLGSQLERALKALFHEPSSLNDHFLSVAITKPQWQVTNFGTEIPSHELPHIFKKFYRVIGTDQWQQGGTGLGLALVKKLVEHMNGTIEVSSGQKQTTFIMATPLSLHSDVAETFV
ncbi:MULTISPECIES: sensor histidine kinase [Cyanophyceae]|uniref:histidine kinase n=1 Tax=Stenomitos frigidus AS-A4 TaxID=2933935 RepID=A0ABV0KTD7_9CYAN